MLMQWMQRTCAASDEKYVNTSYSIFFIFLKWWMQYSHTLCNPPLNTANIGTCFSSFLHLIFHITSQRNMKPTLLHDALSLLTNEGHLCQWHYISCQALQCLRGACMQFLVSWTTPGTSKVEQLLRKLSFFLALKQGNTGLQCEKPVCLCLTGSLASPSGNTTPLCCLHGWHGLWGTLISCSNTFLEVTLLVNSLSFH